MNLLIPGVLILVPICMPASRYSDWFVSISSSISIIPVDHYHPVIFSIIGVAEIFNIRF